MPVYVDPLFDWGGSKEFRWKELHAMALRIGMRLAWFQDDKRLAHYDLVPARRVKAVQFGAVEHTRRQMFEFMRGNK